MKLNRIASLFSVVFLCFAMGNSAWSQMRGGMQRMQGMAQRNPLAFFDRAIQRSGAPALTTDQQDQLDTLIKNYRAARKAAGPDQAVQTARQNFETAVINGDTAGAKDAANAIAAAMANDLPNRLESRADFEIQVLNVLQPQQVSALKQQLGNNRFAALLNSLAGGPGMMGPRMGGFGR